MIKTLPILIALSLVISIFSPFISAASALSGSSFKAGRIIDDSILFNGSSMNTGDIQAFLNSKVPTCDTNHAAGGGYNPPFVCLKNYSQNIQGRSADSYCSGAVSSGIKSAAQIIRDVSTACSINPKVLLVLLQKEQSLITDTWPWPVQYEKATGYGCPDTAPCDPEFAGFFNQIWYAARQFQRYKVQSSLFNYKKGQNNYIQYHPNAGCGGTQIYIENQATAGLYNYTPYQPNGAALANLYGEGDGCSAYGNRNFWRLYSDWFGSSTTNLCNYDNPGGLISDIKFRKYNKNIDSGSLIVYTGSSTNCIENHIWSNNYNSWNKHLVSNQSYISPSNGTVKFSDLDGDGIDEPILLATNNTGSGKVEFHIWDTLMNRWKVHAISNLPTTSLSNLSIEFADLDGNGIDDPLAIGYKDTASGKIEFHVWGPGVKTWQYHVSSNSDSPINPINTQIRFADLDGNGKDEPILVGLNGTNTGKIEFHVWNPGLWSWKSHIVSNADEIDINSFELIFADIDGDGIDNGVLIGKAGTASGRYEFHYWKPGINSWKNHYTSNLLLP